MNTNARPPRGLVALAAVLFLLAVGAVVAGIVLLRGSPSASGTSFEVGRWLLQLGTVLAGTGFITSVLRQVELTRAKRDAWTAMLQDLVVNQDAVEGAGMRLVSNPDAQTYADLSEKCREMRAQLRRIIALPDAYDRRGPLRPHIERMRQYLKPLVKEYETHYLRVTRQGMLDEKVLSARLDDHVGDAELPVQLCTPMGVGRLLQDEKEFPALAAFLRDFDVSESAFRQGTEIDDAYERVKAILRKNAGVRARRR